METVPLTRERSKGKGIPDNLPWKKPFMGYSTPEKKICLKRKSCEE
jgi:hypothetical protein